MLAAIVTDRGSGVDPFSLVIGYKGILMLGARSTTRSTGLALWPLPTARPTIGVGKTAMVAIGSDYQESKNVDQAGETSFRTRPSASSKSVAWPGRR